MVRWISIRVRAPAASAAGRSASGRLPIQREPMSSTRSQPSSGSIASTRGTSREAVRQQLRDHRLGVEDREDRLEEDVALGRRGEEQGGDPAQVEGPRLARQGTAGVGSGRAHPVRCPAAPARPCPARPEIRWRRAGPELAEQLGRPRLDRRGEVVRVCRHRPEGQARGRAPAAGAGSVVTSVGIGSPSGRRPSADGPRGPPRRTPSAPAGTHRRERSPRRPRRARSRRGAADRPRRAGRSRRPAPGTRNRRSSRIRPENEGGRMEEEERERGDRGRRRASSPRIARSDRLHSRPCGGSATRRTASPNRSSAR